MKTLILIVALSLCLVGCSEQQGKMTLWGTYETDAVGARVGYKPDVNSPIEAGVYGAWRPASEDPPNLFGAYTLYEFGRIEVDNPIPIAWLPETLSARPYLGGDITIDLAKDENRTTRGGPLVGLKLQDVIAFETRFMFVNGPLESAYDNSEVVFALCIPIPLK